MAGISGSTIGSIMPAYTFSRLTSFGVTATVSCRAANSRFGPTSERMGLPMVLGMPSRLLCFMIAEGRRVATVGAITLSAEVLSLMSTTSSRLRWRSPLPSAFLQFSANNDHRNEQP